MQYIQTSHLCSDIQWKLEFYTHYIKNFFPLTVRHKIRPNISCFRLVILATLFIYAKCQNNERERLLRWVFFVSSNSSLLGTLVDVF